MTNYEPLMREALHHAKEACDDGDWGVGCVIALQNEIIARGRNRVHSSRNRLAHAEMDALANLQESHFDRRLSKDMLLVTTFEPCTMCFGAIVTNGIRRIVSGVNFDGSGASALAGSMPKYLQQPRFATTFITGVLERDCAEMWAASDADPIKCMLADGFIFERSLDELDNSSSPTIYTTRTVLPNP